MRNRHYNQTQYFRILLNIYILVIHIMYFYYPMNPNLLSMHP